MRTIYSRDNLTGGHGKTDLDAVPYGDLSGGEWAFIVRGDGFHPLVYDPDSVLAHNPPWVVKPIDAAGPGRWIRAEQALPAYGVRWDSVNDIMQPGIVISGMFVPSDYENFPVQEQMARGLLNDGVFSLMDPDDSRRMMDGSVSVLDGSAGQVMVRIPKFWALAVQDGAYKYCLISPWSFSFMGHEAYVPPAFGNDLYRYVGAFQGVAATDASSADVISAVKDTSGYSYPYPNPFSNRTRAQFRAQMQEGFFQFSWGIYEIVWMLFLTEYKTFDSQAVLPGYTGGNAWDYAYTRPAGRTVGLGNLSGSIIADLDGVDADLAGIVDANEYVANSFRGIENFFGNVWVLIDGINIDNTDGSCHVYVCHDPDSFADDTAVGYIDTGHAPGFGDSDNYVKNLAWSPPDCLFYPSEIGNGATSGSFITDYHWNTAGGWRVLRVGGYLAYGALAGLGFLSARSASSAAGSAVSARSAA